MYKIFCLSFSLLYLLVFSEVRAQQAKPQTATPAVVDSSAMFNGIFVSADLAGPVMYLFNQDKLQTEVAVQAGFKNRFYPVIELGLAKAEIESDEGFTFKAKPSMYFRTGLDYAIVRKQGNMFFMGLRYGVSRSNYDIYNITQFNDYWGETQVVDILNQKATAQFAQVVAGIRVKMLKNLYLGWNVRYSLLFSTTEQANSRMWFIPGYGINNNNSSAAMMQFQITYKLPFFGKDLK
ncbi:MAG: DUF6048 family protein [Bacteroidales bacterium]